MVNELAQLIINGLVAGSVLAMAAVGVTLVYGVLKVVNFAHGDYLTFGAYCAFVASATWHLNMVVATIIAILLTAALAVVLEFVLWRPLRRRRSGVLTLFLVAIGLALILRQALLLGFGGASRAFAVDQFTVHTVGPIRLSTSALIALILAAAANVTVGIFLARTRMGKSMRAYADNPKLADISGINTNRLVVAAWVLAGGLAGLAGVLQGLVQSAFDPNMGWSLLLPIFAAVVLGTIGNAYGALVGGLVLGLVMSVSTWSGFAGGVPGSYQEVVAFGALIIVLLVRPQGFFAQAGSA